MEPGGDVHTEFLIAGLKGSRTEHPLFLERMKKFHLSLLKFQQWAPCVEIALLSHTGATRLGSHKTKG